MLVVDKTSHLAFEKGHRPKALTHIEGGGAVMIITQYIPRAGFLSTWHASYGGGRLLALTGHPRYEQRLNHTAVKKKTFVS